VRVTREKTENSQTFLSIEMEPDEIEKSLEKSYRRLVKKTNIPGFRKGKAPREILERYIGRGSLLEDALDELIPNAYQEAIKEQGIEAIAQPQIEITQVDPVVFKATVPLKPTVELGDYHSIRVTPEVIEIKEEDVNAAMEQLRHRYATWEPVERPVEFSDLVVLDVESTVEDKPLINQQGAQYQVLENLLFPAPGFAEQLVGMKAGEEKSFALQYPEDYSRSELANKEAQFKVKISEVKQERLPELNDEFARTVNPDFETIDSLREKVVADLKREIDERNRIDLENRAIEAVVGITKLEFPPVLVELEINRLIEEQARRWQMTGRGLDEYLKAVNKTEDELREELRPMAEKRITQSLVLGKIAEEEKIEVANSEIDAEIKKMTEGTGSTEDKEELRKFLDTPQSRGSIERILLTQKTVQRLVEIAKGPAEE